MTGQRTARTDEAGQHEDDGQPAADHIGRWYQDGFEDPPGLVGSDERAKGGAGQRQNEGDRSAGKRAFVAMERQQRDDGKETQRIGSERSPTAQGPCEQLHGADQECHDGGAGRSVVAELRQETAGPVRQPSGDGGDAGEVRPCGLEKLVLLLKMKVIRIAEGEEAVNGDAGQCRQPGQLQHQTH